MTDRHTIKRELLTEVRALKLKALPVSDHTRLTLRRVVSVFDYYLDIYSRAVATVEGTAGKRVEDLTVVDYGGGNGLMSVFLKRIGCKRVLYVDNNPEALQTAGVLMEQLGTRPDLMLEGHAGGLKAWCRDNGVVPDAVIGIDVIERIYVLDDFFSALNATAPRLVMLFSTAATPYNSRVMRKLRHGMWADEMGTAGKKGFRALRREFIVREFPTLPPKDADYWAEHTRGLTYKDIRRAVENQTPNLLRDPYNTCNPATGEWSRRILPVTDYRQLLAPYHYELRVIPGLYNDHRFGPKEWMSLHYNKIIRAGENPDPHTWRERRHYRKALKTAPFLYLLVTKEKEAKQ